MDNNHQQKGSRGQTFVSFVIERMKNDAGFGAALRRADNSATEYQAWEYLSKWCDLEKSWERQAFTTIAASLARSKPQKDGGYGVGQAIALSYGDGGNQSDPAKTKLRRLLACTNTEEACVILRPLLSLVDSRGIKVCYARLLDELLYFNEKVRIHWATDFYGKGHKDDSLSI